jgi:hypothetical protein
MNESDTLKAGGQFSQLPPTIAICCLVRDGVSYLPSFRRQLESLILDDNGQWNLYCVEGDSHDGSWQFLQEWAAQDSRITVSQLHVGRAADKDALAINWARAGNACFDLIPKTGQHTHVLWLESDLCFPPETARRLIAHNVDVVAPVIFLGGQFYDTWGFRGLDGSRWANQAPYHADYRAASLLPMQSVGSCVLFSRSAFDTGIRMRPTYENGLLVGMCNDARSTGLKVWADTGTAILHPVDNWEAQMWEAAEVVICKDGSKQIVRPSEYSSKGIGRHLAMLDPDWIVSIHKRFLRNQFKTLCTNHIRVDIVSVANRRRRYRMTISPKEPTGLWAIPVLRNRVSFISVLVAKLFKSWEFIKTGSSEAHSILACVCNVRVKLDTDR